MPAVSRLDTHRLGKATEPKASRSEGLHTTVDYNPEYFLYTHHPHAFIYLSNACLLAGDEYPCARGILAVCMQQKQECVFTRPISKAITVCRVVK